MRILTPIILLIALIVPAPATAAGDCTATPTILADPLTDGMPF